MRSSTRKEARRRARAARTPSVLWDLVFLNALFCVGLASIFQIFETPWFALVASAGLIIGNVVAWLSVRRAWPAWLTLLVIVGSYLVTGLPLAAPSVLTAPGSAVKLFTDVVTAPVTGWKDILTLDLPLGTYQATLALVLFLTIVMSTAALLIAWRSTALWGFAAPVGLLFTVFGILFGSSVLRGEVGVANVTILGVSQLLIGLTAMLVAFLWIVWRIAAARSASLNLAKEASGAHLGVKPGRAAASRWVLAGSMLAIAVVAGLVATPLMVSGSTRDVLRTNVDPELHLQHELSPLVSYREYFSDEWYDTELFRVEASGAVDRVRLATMSYYDGTVAGVVSPTLGEEAYDTAFLRVPSTIPIESGDSASATVEIDAYRGVWVPTVGAVSSITFEGSEAVALADGFFYNRTSQTGVVLSDPGLVAGSSYATSGSQLLVPQESVTSFTAARTGPSIDDSLAPERLEEWIELQEVSSDGAGLLELIDRLQQRGFLSHDLMIEENTAPAWMGDLGAYTFEPSRAGHSADRIDQLFTGLIERQEEVSSDADNAVLVGATGDDEQFAVAALLVADHLGFDARIAVGALLTREQSDSPTVAPCDNGVCTGKNMTAWVEVQDATSGDWAAVGVTPQHENPPSPDVEQRSDPLNQTEVDLERVDTVPPPDANPSDGTSDDEVTEDNGLDLSWLWQTLRLVGIVLLLLLIIAGPFIIILIAKSMRTRSRQAHNSPRHQIAGGWAEYVDAAVDHGKPYPRTETRQELAALYGGEVSHAKSLATRADQAVFSAQPVATADTVEFWNLVEAERSELGAGLTRRARVRAKFSLRSFKHGLKQARREADAHARDHQSPAKETRMNFRLTRSGQ